MRPVRAFIRRMTHQNPIALLLAGATALIVLLALASSGHRGGPSLDDPTTSDLDAQTAPASGVPPEDGGQADIIPPDEGGDDSGGAAAPEGSSTAAPPAP